MSADKITNQTTTPIANEGCLKRFVRGSGGRIDTQEWKVVREGAEWVLMYRTRLYHTWTNWQYETTRGREDVLIFDNERSARKALKRRCQNTERQARYPVV